MIRTGDLRIFRRQRMLLRDGKVLGLSRYDYACVEALLLGGRLTRNQIFDAMYRAREDGGPLYAARSLDKVLPRLRKKLAFLGISIHHEGPRNQSRRFHAALES